MTDLLPGPLNLHATIGTWSHLTLWETVVTSTARVCCPGGILWLLSLASWSLIYFLLHLTPKHFCVPSWGERVFQRGSLSPQACVPLCTSLTSSMIPILLPLYHSTETTLFRFTDDLHIAQPSGQFSVLILFPISAGLDSWLFPPWITFFTWLSKNLHLPLTWWSINSSLTPPLTSNCEWPRAQILGVFFNSPLNSPPWCPHLVSWLQMPPMLTTPKIHHKSQPLHIV